MMEYHDLGYGSWGMDRIARWGMDRGMDRGVWIACGPGPLIHTLYFDLHPCIMPHSTAILNYHQVNRYLQKPNKILFSFSEYAVLTSNSAFCIAGQELNPYG